MADKSFKRRLEILADAARYDASCASSGSRRPGAPDSLGSTTRVGICHSYTPDGRCVSLLKLLLTNHCVYDCQYCVNRASSQTERAAFTPDEVVWLTVEFYRRNYIEGLFLSSGIVKSADHTMDQLVAVARRLRVDEGFRGYIHLKAAPGAAPEVLAEAGRWADRLSANIELATAADLSRLAPGKTFDLVEGTMATIASKRAEAVEERRRTTRAPASSASKTRPTAAAARRCPWPTSTRWARWRARTACPCTATPRRPPGSCRSRWTRSVRPRWRSRRTRLAAHAASAAW